MRASEKLTQIIDKQRKGQEVSARDLESLKDALRLQDGQRGRSMSSSSFSGTQPEPLSANATPAIGSLEEYARADHQHGIDTIILMKSKVSAIGGNLLVRPADRLACWQSVGQSAKLYPGQAPVGLRSSR